MVNIGSTSGGGRVLNIKADLAKIQLMTPACTEIGEKVALSRRIEKHWRLIGASCPPSLSRWDSSQRQRTGWGTVLAGTCVDVQKTA